MVLHIPASTYSSNLNSHFCHTAMTEHVWIPLGTIGNSFCCLLELLCQALEGSKPPSSTIFSSLRSKKGKAYPFIIISSRLGGITDDIYSLKERSRISVYPICLTPPRLALLVIDFLPHFFIIIAI